MKTLKFLIVSAVFASLASCQTMEGLGRDVQQAGSNLEDAATN